MKHIKYLDGLRFYAVFLVLLQHFLYFFGNKINAGYYGVDLFFVISGYLITTILLSSGEPFPNAYKKFLGRRTLRIFPLYYLIIILLYLLNTPTVRENFFLLFTYTYNFSMATHLLTVNPVMHFWSLCVEEQFYLFWPFLILPLRKKLLTLKMCIIVLLLVCGGQLLFDIIPSLKVHNHFGLFPRAFSMTLGGLGAVLMIEKKIPLKMLENYYLEIIIFILLAIFLVTDFKAKFIAFPILSLFILLKISHQGFRLKQVNQFLLNKRISYLGTISYGIYILHLPVAYYLSTYFFNPLIWENIDFSTLGIFSKLQYHSWILKFPLYTGVTILLAHLSYKYFEKPILLKKDKFFKYSVREEI